MGNRSFSLVSQQRHWFAGFAASLFFSLLLTVPSSLLAQVALEQAPPPTLLPPGPGSASPDLPLSPTAPGGTSPTDPPILPPPTGTGNTTAPNGAPANGTISAQASPPLGALGIGVGGGGGMGGLFSPVVGIVPFAGSYHAADFFREPVRGQNANLGYAQENLSVLTPLWQNKTDELSANAHVAVQSYDTAAILPTTGQRFPAELWNVGVGSGYRHLFDNGWIGGGFVEVGSASDRPFSNFNVMTISASGFLRVPSGERNAWIFMVAMSSNSQILPYIPIPGVAYFYAPSNYLQALIGFPFANVTYRPADNWAIQVSYALLTNFHARVNYRVARPVRLYAGLDLENQNYFRADRTVATDRFFYYDDRLSAGMQVIFNRHALLDLSGGYLFARTYFEAQNGTSQGINQVNVAPGPYVGGTLQIRY